MNDLSPLGVVEVDAPTVKVWLDRGEALLIDVRETHEYEYEHVPGAFLLPLSFLDPATFPRLTDRKVVVMCQVGKRSAAAAKQLADTGIRGVFNLAGGLDGWGKAGLTTEGAKHEVIDYQI
jgi:rhodanese-related sulfurtransferase